MSYTHPEFGEIESGTGAACYDIVEANHHQFIDDIFFNLKKIGYDVPFPKFKTKEINVVPVAEAYYDFYENAFEEDIPNSCVNYLKSHGIEVRVQFTYDELYDVSDLDNDDIEEEE